MTDVYAPPAFQFYPREWLTDTTLLTLEQKGALMDLRAHAWLAASRGDSPCSLPNDDAKLARLSGLGARWRKVGADVRAFFRIDGDRLVDDQLLGNRLEMESYHRTKSSAGATGAARKWEGSDEHDARVTREKNRNQAATRSQRLSDARARGTHTAEQWQEMLAAYRHTCLRCGQSAPDVKIVKDHVTPIYQGGSDAITNLQPMCAGCNSSKGPDNTDHRIGRAETRPEWLGNARQTPTSVPSEMRGKRLARFLANAYPASASASASASESGAEAVISPQNGAVSHESAPAAAPLPTPPPAPLETPLEPRAAPLAIARTADPATAPFPPLPPILPAIAFTLIQRMPAEKQLDGDQQLRATLTPGGARLKAGEYVRAFNPDHLAECCRLVLDSPPDNPGQLARWVLLKLRDSFTETRAKFERFLPADDPTFSAITMGLTTADPAAIAAAELEHAYTWLAEVGPDVRREIEAKAEQIFAGFPHNPSMLRRHSEWIDQETVSRWKLATHTPQRV